MVVVQQREQLVVFVLIFNLVPRVLLRDKGALRDLVLKALSPWGVIFQEIEEDMCVKIGRNALDLLHVEVGQRSGRHC